MPITTSTRFMHTSKGDIMFDYDNCVYGCGCEWDCYCDHDCDEGLEVNPEIAEQLRKLEEEANGYTHAH